MAIQKRFETICRDQRDELAADAAAWLRLKHDPPFLLVLSFINPHDICYMAIRNNDDRNRGPLAPLAEALELPPDVSRDQFFKEHCLPLPDNFEPQLTNHRSLKQPCSGGRSRSMPATTGRLSSGGCIAGPIAG